MERNIDKQGRAARGGLAVIFLLIGACLVSNALLLGAIFIVIRALLRF